MDSKNLKYIIPSIILLILSAFGIFYLINYSKLISSIPNGFPPETSITPTIAPTPTIIALPTVSITPVATATPTKKLTPTVTPKITATPSASPTITPKITITPTPSTISITPTPTPTPTELTFSSSTDGFSIVYSSFRKLYQDKESSGNRYTFYSNSGNFAVHVGLNGQWAWTTANRNFSGNLVISGQNTYRYDTDSQTIVDIQYNSKNYTLQCVHNGKSTLKAECETFLKSFKLL